MRDAMEQEKEWETEKEAAPGKVIAVWGSPGAGKTVTAAALAWRYGGQRKLRTALVFCGSLAPMLPCAAEDAEIIRRRSLGSICAARTVTRELAWENRCLLRGVDTIALYGFLRGEHAGNYPPLGARQAAELIGALRGLYEVVVLDCASDAGNEPLTEAALREADEVVRLMSCELKSLSFYASETVRLEERGIGTKRFLRVVSNVKDRERAERMYRRAAFWLPYAEEVEQANLAGDLLRDMERKGSREYVQAIGRLAEELIGDGRRLR